MNTTSVKQKVGLALAGLISLSNIPSVLTAPPAGEVGPPIAILILDSILGVVGLVAVVIAWRTGARAAIRVAAGCLILVLLTALPAFFVGVPVWIKLLTAASVLLTVAAVVLMFSPSRRGVPALS